MLILVSLFVRRTDRRADPQPVEQDGRRSGVQLAMPRLVHVFNHGSNPVLIYGPQLGDAETFYYELNVGIAAPTLEQC